MGKFFVFTLIAVLVAIIVTLMARLDERIVYMFSGLLVGALVWAPAGYAMAMHIVSITQSRVADQARARRVKEAESIYEPQAVSWSPPALTSPRRKFYVLGASGDTTETDPNTTLELEG